MCALHRLSLAEVGFGVLLLVLVCKVQGPKYCVSVMSIVYCVVVAVYGGPVAVNHVESGESFLSLAPTPATKRLHVTCITFLVRLFQ